MVFAGTENVSRTLLGVNRKPYNFLWRGLNQYIYEDRWTTETAATATFPRISGNERNFYDSDLWLQDASYLRLKSAEISYTMKNAMLEKAGVQKLRIYINGYNLFTWTDLEKFDPESVDTPVYPLVKVYNLGLNLTF